MSYYDDGSSDLQDYINNTVGNAPEPGGDRLDYSQPVSSTPKVVTYTPSAYYDEGGNYFPKDERYPVPKVEPPPSPPAPPSGGGGLSYSGSDPLAWLRAQFGGMAPTAESLRRLYEALKAGGVNVSQPTRAGGALSDDKLLINGQMWDFIQDVGGPGARWQELLDTGDLAGDNRGYPAGPVGEPNLSSVAGRTNFEQFDDPSASLLERLALDRVERLSQTPDRAQLDAYARMLQEKEAANQARAREFAGTVRSRAEELKGPAFSDQDEARLRARSFEKLEQRRQETLKNEREKVYLRGFAPTSGIVAGAERAVNTDFEQARTGREADLLNYMMEETQRRKDKAVQLESLAQQALAGGDVTSLQYMAQLADFEDAMIKEADARERERMAAAGIPVDLANNRTQLALQILGQGGSPNDVISGLLGLGQLGNQSRGIDAGLSAAKWQGIGSLLGGGLSALFGGGGK